MKSHARAHIVIETADYIIFCHAEQVGIAWRNKWGTAAALNNNLHNLFAWSLHPGIVVLVEIDWPYPHKDFFGGGKKLFENITYLGEEKNTSTWTFDDGVPLIMNYAHT